MAAAAAAAVTTTVAWAEKEKMPSGFDPEALERGAKALREIQNSEHARKVLDMAKQQEATKQAEAQQKEAEAQQAANQAKVEQERVHWEEVRKTNQQQSEQRAQLARYEDELARKRQEAEAEAQRQRNAEFIKMQEESAERQEALKRQTEEKRQKELRETAKAQADAEAEKLKAQAIAEAEGRTKENRQNEDVQRRQMEARIQQETRKAVEVVNATLSSLGSGLSSLLDDRQRVASLALGAALVGLGIYSAREGAKVGARALERRLSQPALVRDSSRRSITSPLKPSSARRQEQSSVLGDVVLESVLFERLEQLATAAQRARSRGAPMRNLLLYGPPGTGKTMAAKRIAKHAGMDYAILDGGDVAPLGANAVPKLHEVFDWASRSRSGVVLFVDEADAFLSRRGGDATDASRSAVNAFLSRSGSQSGSIMIVLATNRPFDLDPAVVDRMDDALQVPLPGEEERLRIIRLYFDRYIRRGEGEPALEGQNRPSGPPIEVDGVSDEDLKRLASLADGFSGRELAKLVGGLQAAAYGSEDGVLTHHRFWSVADLKLAEHGLRDALTATPVSTSTSNSESGHAPSDQHPNAHR